MDKKIQNVLAILRFINERFDEGAYQIYVSALYGDDDTTLGEAIADALKSLESPVSESNHQEQVYQCQDCGHTMTERELGTRPDLTGQWHLELYCTECGSNHIRLWVG